MKLNASSTRVFDSTEMRIWKRLAWKEMRLLAPLLLAMIACGLILYLPTLSGSFYDGTLAGIVLHLLPSMFALGIGPVLVSQEKEMRTLGWISSLPVRWQTLVQVKFCVASGALLLCWLVSWLLYSVFATSRSHVFFQIPEWLYPLNSVFLLLMSFAVAWITPNSMAALVTIIPIAVVPALLSVFLPYWAILPVYLLVGASVARYSLRHGPLSFVNRTGGSFRWSWLSALDAGYKRKRSSPRSTEAVVPTLLWQVVMQNRMVWVSVAYIAMVVFLAILVGVMVTEKNSFTRTYFPGVLGLLGLLGFLVLSWLGASVFGSDATRQRIRFLAERGVAPGIVWWTRQVIPLSVMMSGLVAMGVTSQILMHLSHPSPIPWFAITVAAFAVYAATQWATQWMRSPLIAVSTAPAIGMAAIAYYAFAMSNLASQAWVLLVSIALAFLATRLMMRRWMDGNLGIKYWMCHLGFFGAALVLPVLPFLKTMVTYPTVATDVQRSLAEERSRYAADERVTELVLGKWNRGEEISATDSPKLNLDSIRDCSQKTLADLETQLANSVGALHASPMAVTFVLREAKLSALRLQRDVNDIEARSRYQRSMHLLRTIVPRLRQRGRLREQELADRLEKWMVAELSTLNAAEALGPEEFLKSAQLLADHYPRQQARRRALLLSWQTSPNRLGEMEIPFPLHGSYGPLLWASRTTKCVQLLLEYLESSDRLVAEERYDKFLAFWNPGSHLSKQEVTNLGMDEASIPGALWHEPWEEAAKHLIKDRARSDQAPKLETSP